MTNTNTLNQFLNMFEVKDEALKSQSAQQLLNKALDNLHQALLVIPGKDPVTGFLSEERKEVLIALHHASFALSLIESQEEEEDRGSGR